MSIKHLIIKALCVTLCLGSMSSSEESARDFIEHVLRIPNPDRVLNSVLGRLERNRQALSKEARLDNSDCQDSDTVVLPEYTESIQPSREKELRHVTTQKHYPICHLERKIKKLNTDEYEYRPAYYEEVRCTMATSEDLGVTNEICSSLGFSCVQWNKTIHLTRRRYSSDCWETRTLVIPAGCECMWPVYRLGDMKLHV